MQIEKGRLQIEKGRLQIEKGRLQIEKGRLQPDWRLKEVDCKRIVVYGGEGKGAGRSDWSFPMDPRELKRRTKDFAKRVINLCRQLPQTEEGRLIRNQLFRSGTSVGSNYRAACRGRSKADFISKLGIVLEEADESLYWMEIIVETNVMKAEQLSTLMEEANQLIAIFVSSLNTAKG